MSSEVWNILSIESRSLSGISLIIQEEIHLSAWVDNHQSLMTIAKLFASIPKSLSHAVAYRPIESLAIEALVERKNFLYVFESTILNFKPWKARSWRTSQSHPCKRSNPERKIAFSWQHSVNLSCSLPFQKTNFRLTQLHWSSFSKVDFAVNWSANCTFSWICLQSSLCPWSWNHTNCVNRCLSGLIHSWIKHWFAIAEWLYFAIDGFVIPVSFLFLVPCWIPVQAQKLLVMLSLWDGQSRPVLFSLSEGQNSKFWFSLLSQIPLVSVGLDSWTARLEALDHSNLDLNGSQSLSVVFR